MSSADELWRVRGRYFELRGRSVRFAFVTCVRNV